MQTRSVLFMNQHPMAPKLTQSGADGQRYGIDGGAAMVMRRGGIPHLANVGGQLESRHNGVVVAELVLGVGDFAVVAHVPLVGAGESETDGIAMRHVDRVAWL